MSFTFYRNKKKSCLATALLIKKNKPTNDTFLETFYSRILKQNVLIKKTSKNICYSKHHCCRKILEHSNVIVIGLLISLALL